MIAHHNQTGNLCITRWKQGPGGIAKRTQSRKAEFTRDTQIEVEEMIVDKKKLNKIVVSV
jgi:hypothetical protein